MRRLLLLLILFPLAAFGQAGRFDYQVTTINQSAPAPGGLYPVLAIPGSGIAICTAPANAVPCTNYATTYSNAAQSTTCTPPMQLTRAGSSLCVAGADAQGGFGLWAVAGNYQYTITTPYGSFGPYDFTIGGGAGGGVNPGTQFRIGQYNAAGTDIVQTNSFTDVTGNSLNHYFYASLFAAGAGTPGSPYTSASGTGGIQEAVNAAEAQPVVTGGFAPTVYIPSGSYATTNSVLVTKTVNLVGAGWATQLIPSTSGAPVILVQPTSGAEIEGMHIRDFTIAANSGGGCGITLDGTSNVITHLHIEHVNIRQQGSNAICAFGAGSAQGTPVLSTIENSLLFGGISMIQGGDSIKIDHNVLSGTGQNDFGNIAGAVGFIFEHNNITMQGGTHFGNTVTNSSSFTPSLKYNEFETPSGFTGSNGALLDLDQNVVNAKVTGNSFVLLSGTSPASIRLNNAVSSNIGDNYFSCAAGISGGSTGVTATTSAAHNIMLETNYFFPSSPCTTPVNATNVEVQNRTSNFATGFYLPSNEFFGNVNSGGTPVNLLGLDASDNTRLNANGGCIAQSHSGDSPHFRTDFYDSSPNCNIGLEISDIVAVPASTATFAEVNGIVVASGAGVFDSSANLLVPGNAGGHTGTGLMVEAVSPALTGTPTAPTATVGTNTTQIATTAFVLANSGSGSIPTGTTNQMLYYAAGGTTLTPLTLGTNLSITSGTLNASSTAATNFNALTSGTNTTAAMVVGAGGSLNFTSTGTINASTLAGSSIGTSGATIPLLSTANTFALSQTMSAILTASAGLTMPSGQCLNWNSDTFLSRISADSLGVGSTCGASAGSLNLGTLAAGVVQTSSNGVNITGAKVGIGSAGGALFSSTTAGNGTPDVGIDRSAAGVAEVNNGTVGNSSGSLKASTFTSTVAIGSAPFTVTSTTPVANLSIGGNAATSTTATNLSGTPALPNGTTATTQTTGDNTTKIATDAFVLANAGFPFTLGSTSIGSGSSTQTINGMLGLGFVNATSGSISIAAPTGALGTQTLQLPDITGTLIAAQSGSFIVGSGTSANTDGVGELTVSAATSIGYTFINTTYTSHPECIAEVQGTTPLATSISYTGTTAFTINFPSAFTGTVSYHCDMRN